MSAKQQALQDIKAELKSEGRSFIAFYRELNETMKELVKEHINKQKKLKK